jgi:Uma2 family endonuclease
MVRPAHDRRDALYEEYLAVPSHLRAEIIGGTLYVLPRSSPRHANATSVLGGELSGPFQRGRSGPGGWWILDEPELQLDPKEPIVPDLAGWRIERMPELPEAAYFTVAPDWVCEVLSQSTEKIDRDEKLPYYAHHRVRHVWLLDPSDKRLEVHALDDDGRWRAVRIYEGDGVVRSEPFDAIEFGALWSAPRVVHRP